MIRPGVVSVTFRNLSPEDIVDLAVRGKLDAIEWGGDIHVPHGDLKRAREVRTMTVDAGLSVASYGSYYCIGREEPVSFEQALATTVELGAPTLRCWAGSRSSDEADSEYRDHIVRETRRVADLAAREGIVIALEFHLGTLTDCKASARSLLENVAHENVKTYWQPPRGSRLEDNLETLDAVLPWLLNVHVFHWDPVVPEDGQVMRLWLSEGTEAWELYLRKVASSHRDHYALLEFVKEDSPEAFLQDAETLGRLLSRL